MSVFYLWVCLPFRFSRACLYLGWQWINGFLRLMIKSFTILQLAVNFVTWRLREKFLPLTFFSDKPIKCVSFCAQRLNCFAVLRLTVNPDENSYWLRLFPQFSCLPDSLSFYFRQLVCLWACLLLHGKLLREMKNTYLPPCFKCQRSIHQNESNMTQPGSCNTTEACRFEVWNDELEIDANNHA